MKQPTKAQLRLAVAYYQACLEELIVGPFLSAEDLFEEIKRIAREAPSIAPDLHDGDYHSVVKTTDHDSVEKTYIDGVLHTTIQLGRGKYDGKLPHQVRGWSPDE